MFRTTPTTEARLSLVDRRESVTAKQLASEIYYQTMSVGVTLRRVTPELRGPVEALRVAPAQTELVAPNEKSLRESDSNSVLRSYAVFNGGERGMDRPESGPLGFAQVEVTGGVGFIQRVMIDDRFQGKGYGAALLAELIRRLRLDPDAEIIATSHRRGNEKMARLLSKSGFVPWKVPWSDSDPDEIYLVIPRD